MPTKSVRNFHRRRLAIGAVATVFVTAAVVFSSQQSLTGTDVTVRSISKAAASTRIALPTTTVVPSFLPAPSPTLVYSGPNIVLVGVELAGDISVGTGKSRLYISTDMSHWTDVTPPQFQTGKNGTYEFFDQASFLNQFTGWVTGWNPVTAKTTIYRTSDGGKTWTVISGGSHSANAGSDTLIDLVGPTTAFEETLDSTAPSMSLSVTTDGGRNWNVVYRNPSRSSPGSALMTTSSPDGHSPEPFMMPTTFMDARHGFAAGGVLPTEPEDATSDFFYTSDGGATWQRQTPPLPDPTLLCMRADTSNACSYTLPVFSDSRRGTLAGVVTTGTQAQVALDVTSDGGQHWTKISQLSVAVAPDAAQGMRGNAFVSYPLVSLTPGDSWWVLGWDGSSISTRTSTDQGTSWVTHRAALLAGTPRSLHTFNSTDALLTTENITPQKVSIQLLYTQDGGEHWTAFLP